MDQNIRIEFTESFDDYWRELIGQAPASLTTINEEEGDDEVEGNELPIGCFSQNDS